MRGETGFPVRLRFVKRGKVRFVSHRDVARAFERAFRVVQLPLAFTQGFSPRPRVSFGLALSVGCESDAEYLDVALERPVDLRSLLDALSDALPEGIEVTGAAELVERAPALQESVGSVAYVVDTPTDAVVALDAVRAALAAERIEVTRARKGREELADIRPAIRRLEVVDAADLDATPAPGARLELEVATRPVGVRPGEVLAALGLAEGRVRRTHQWIERDGARREPLEADARPCLVEARAS